MNLYPALEDLGADEDDNNEFTEDPHNEEEDEVQPDFPDEEVDGGMMGRMMMRMMMRCK